ncbi:hypothetical protein D3C87_945990 [compost metagenome]
MKLIYKYKINFLKTYMNLIILKLEDMNINIILSSFNIYYIMDIKHSMILEYNRYNEHPTNEQ